ncbi:MAG: GNAT family N-acetyltransferase [Anaerobacillus sp.]|uniref:GNAT family N-acetyltransferase n=1 Tax=Anaerobacillus sp. TaxID=1872506 RepID=UPI00391D3AAB
MTSLNQIKLDVVHQENRQQYLEYLLLADESEVAINKYINEGEMFSIHYENKMAGVVIFNYHSQLIVELKNIALAPNFRGKGLGKLVITKACELYKRKGNSKVIVGTANSSIGNLAFYQKVGFRMTEIKKDFFRDYPEPIYEDGIRALDMVMFEKYLT